VKHALPEVQLKKLMHAIYGTGARRRDYAQQSPTEESPQSTIGANKSLPVLQRREAF
jgi:hypothetical protein